MGFWNKYPYTDFHELNLSWFLDRFKDLIKEWDEFEVINKIAYQGNWNITHNYHTGSIVTDDGSFYVSIQDVPAGIDISNGAYWALIPDITAMPAEQNIVIIGDSYGTTNGSGEGTITPYPVYLQQYLGLDDAHFHGAFRNGSGFANGRFLERLETLTPSDLVTELYVFGGWNDTESRVTDAAVIAGMDTFSAKARQMFPNAKLYLGMLCYSYSTNQSYLNDFAHLQSLTYGKCTEHGFDAFVNSFPAAVSCNASDWFDITTSSGSSHPSTNGSQKIASKLATLINTKKLSFIRRTEITYTAAAGFTLTGSPLTQSSDGNVVTTASRAHDRFVLHSDTPFSLSGNTASGNYTTVATIDESISNFSAYYTTFICPCRYVIDGESGYTNGFIELTLHLKEIQLRALYATVSNITDIYIMPRGTITNVPVEA